eukprot:Opistho-2@80939
MASLLEPQIAAELQAVNHSSHPLALGDDEDGDEVLQLPGPSILRCASESRPRTVSSTGRVIQPYETITDAERKAISELRSQLDKMRATSPAKDIPRHDFDDHDHVRFLRGNEMRIRDSATQMIQAEVYIAQCRPSQLTIAHVEEELKKGYAYFQAGVNDALGRSILVFDFQKFNPKTSDRVDVFRLGIYLMERALENAPTHAHQVVMLMNYDNWKLKQSDRIMSKTLTAILTTVYAEHIGAVYLLNTPGYFKILWKMVKPWLPKRTVKKICMTSNAKLREDKSLTLACIPAFLGGSCGFNVEAWIQRRYTAEGLDGKATPKHVLDEAILAMLKSKERTAEDDALETGDD